MVHHWLIKSEAEVYSIDHLAKDGTTAWTGVRNFKARNFMREMKVGDPLLYYHSNGDPSGAAGVAKVTKQAFPDATQFDRTSDYFEPKANPEKPYWYNVEVGFVSRFARFVSLEEIKEDPKLRDMLLISGKASRLSVQPIEKRHFDHLVKLGSG
jgi:predicted RNA-binding protein with PUA-like domain